MDKIIGIFCSINDLCKESRPLFGKQPDSQW